jgi:hypothetical protein
VEHLDEHQQAFEVRSNDEHGDVHIFGTDEEELAHEMVETMKEDLQEMTFTGQDCLTRAWAFCFLVRWCSLPPCSSRINSMNWVR